jgi:pimeloyl-ACP methyl ester carboxylesterase
MAVLEVPGARLYYETRGDGPRLLAIGSPMDSGGFAPLAEALSDRYTVVTYDPRGLGQSTREDTDEHITPEMQAEDVHRLIESTGGGPVDYFGSSGGAVVGLALVQAHPSDVRAFVAHEPPVVESLPDKDRVRAQMEEVYQTYRSDGTWPAMQLFLSYAGFGGGGGDGGGWQPSPEEQARMAATNAVFFEHLIRQTTGFVPDVEALRSAPTQIVVGVGEASAGQLANRTALALAEQLGTTPVEFPGDHGGFLAQPEPFARQLAQLFADSDR